MIKIRFFKEYNLFRVQFNKESESDFNDYINTLTTKLIKVAKTYHEGGWLFHIDLLPSVKKYFSNIVYENEPFLPAWDYIGNDLKLPPYQYQKEAIYNILRIGEALLVLPCGSGKSLILIGAYHELKKSNKIQGQGLVLVKASLKIQWSKEVPKFSNYSASVLKTYADRCSKFNTKIKKLEKEMEKSGFNQKEIKRINKEIKKLKKESMAHFKEQFNNCDLLVANYETLLDDKVLKELKDRNIEFVAGDEIRPT